MKNKILFLFVLISAVIIIGCSTAKKKQVIVPDGYQGIYVVEVWKGDNSVLPKGITGLVLKRTGSSYDIMLSNIDVKQKKAEEIEKLEYTFKEGTFLIKFGGTMKVKPAKGGLDGTLDYDGKPAKLFLKKIK
jgi:hypothetical protein